MSVGPGRYQEVAELYDRLAQHGAYGTLAPGNRGGRKGEYVASVFDAVLLPRIRAGGFRALLDFGCGTGIFARQAAAMVEELAGVDVSRNILAVAAQACAGLPNVRFLHTDGERLPFDGGAFDCIVAREVLCYVPDGPIEDTFAELYRVLRPGGRLFVIDQVSEAPYWQHYPGTPHQIKRAPGALADSARRAGFALTEHAVVRTPRFPFVYLAWWHLVPRRALPVLARLEVAWHRQRRRPTRRWWDDLFVFSKR
ncbi:MAG TPA: class I SAM-dependent methyltransferase [Gammaproteobacteria bacterium]|jgi:SAM-dependent methyltransferase